VVVKNARRAENSVSPASITKIRNDREARARRYVELARLLRENPQATNVELAEILHVNRDTIAEDRKQLMTLARNEAVTETQLYREDQLTRIQQKWEEIESDETMTGAEKHLAWSRWMKLEMDLRGTAAPTRSISANVDVNQQVIPIEQQLEYLQAFAGLYPDERLEELDRVAARKRTCRVVMEAVPMKQLECGS
jgi:hypothetical protein